MIELHCISTGTVKLRGKIYRLHSFPVELKNGKTIHMQVFDTLTVTEDTFEWLIDNGLNLELFRWR